MKREELKKLLIDGKRLDELFRFSSGQECDIFKAESFAGGEEIIYIPDLALNGIVADRPMETIEELEDTLSFCYTGDDFLNLFRGNKNLAERLFWYCDWQNPSSAMPEIEEDIENVLELYDADNQCSFEREDDGTNRKDLGRYELVFRVEGDTYYAYFDAINMTEAVGQFFIQHQTLSMEDLIEMMEV